MPLLLALTVLTAGACLVAAGIRPRRGAALAWLEGEGMGPVAAGAGSEGPPASPFHAWAAELVPATHLARFRRRLELAGLAGKHTPEEVAATQLVLAGLGLVGGFLWAGFGDLPVGWALAAAIVLPVAGALAMPSWLSRSMRARQDRVRMDLPEVLDLLAIAVEAGLGFEAALELVGRDIPGPLADELRRSLREMELGATRKEALHGLKRRTDVFEVNTFVLALTQADALGVPVGRVLRAQADEVRNRRRQWAREKAGKLPVKILFPMVGLIFPAIFVVLLGPAASGIFQALR
jgi:tight adherence protein C